jgi:hypothetical protein
MATTEAEEHGLHVAASAIRVEIGIDRKREELRLAPGGGKPLGRLGSPQIGERA